MTIFECYNATKKELKNAGISDYVFEAKQIVKFITKLTANQILTEYMNELSGIEEDFWRTVLKQRINHRPLQYILGEWSFYGLTFKVGEGCLCPRPDTETLVDAAAEKIRENNVKAVLDLCSGSGCVGITLAKRYEDVSVDLVEKYDIPFNYTSENIALNKTENARAIKADIFDFVPGRKYDIIVSNPPYVAADEMELLDEETKNEPDTALYGGETGLDYYVCILERYIPFVNDGGYIAVEVGFKQAETVKELFKAAGLTDVITKKDFSGIDRVVIGTVNRV